MQLSTAESLGAKSRRTVPPAMDLNSLISVHEWFDNFYQADVENAMSLFRSLRAQGSVVHGMGMDFGAFIIPDLWNWHGRPSAMALTYDAVSKMMTSPEIFGHRLYAAELGEQNPLFQDGPGHRHFRRMVIEAFNPKAVRDWETAALRLSNALIDDLIARGCGNLVSDFSQKLPGQVFTRFIGAPDADAEKLSAWAVRQMSAFGEQAGEAIRRLHAYFEQMIAERRRLSSAELSVRGDLVSLLTRVSVDSRPFNDVEINTTLHVLLIGGTDTVYKALANTLYFLLTQEGTLERVRDDRSLIAKATEEAIRLASPNVFGSARLALIDTQLGSVPIKAGTAVIANLAMANRDPERWDRPDEFDLSRNQRTHLGWGSGPHTCLGMHLAKLIIQSAVNALLDRCPKMRLDASHPKPELAGLGSRSSKHLYVTLAHS